MVGKKTNLLVSHQTRYSICRKPCQPSYALIVGVSRGSYIKDLEIFESYTWKGIDV